MVDSEDSKDASGRGVSSTSASDGLPLLSGSEAIDRLTKLLRNKLCLKTSFHILDHVLMEKVTLEDLETIQKLLLDVKYESFPRKQSFFFETLMNSKSYLTLYMMLKVWNVWVNQKLASNGQAIRFLTDILGSMDGLAPSFRLRLEYALACCHSYAGTERKSYYGWKPDFLNELKKPDGSANEDCSVSMIPKLLTYMKKLIGTSSDQFPSRILRERLAVCMTLIRKLSQKSDESAHASILSTLASMKQVYHVLPRDLLFRYLASCSRLKSRDYLAPWITVCNGLLDHMQSDWLEECIVLESLDYYARHTMYPDTLKHIFQKHETLKETFLNHLANSSTTTTNEAKLIPLNWYYYTQMMTLVSKSHFVHPEELILSKLRDFIRRKEEKQEYELLRRLDQKLEDLLMTLRQIRNSHRGDDSNPN